jgi:hypothetical protein
MPTGYVEENAPMIICSGDEWYKVVQEAVELPEKAAKNKKP